MSDTVCTRCGHAIEWRRSKSGRSYPVNAPSEPRAGQLHSYDCKTWRGDATPNEAPHDEAHDDDNAPENDDDMGRKGPQTGDSLAETIAQAVAQYVKPEKSAVDEKQVRKIVAQALAEAGTGGVTVTVALPSGELRDMGRQHARFPLLLQVIARRLNVWLVGPAGSGKTSAAHKAADALGLAFGAISIGPQTPQSAIFGYMDAHGNYVTTEFRRRYQDGGVFLLDEIDRGNPGVLTALNQAIENGTCAFPDGMIERHKDFVAIAAANTFGTGASREYVGAMQLDAATLDRFVFIEWDYDEALERDLTLATFTAAGGTDASIAGEWLAIVRGVRANAAKLKIRHVVSPRASLRGAELLAAGVDRETVKACVLWKGLDADSIGRLA